MIRFDKATQATSTLASGQNSPVSIANSEEYIYWASAFGLTINRVHKDQNSPPEEVARGTDFGMTAIAIDETALYWLDTGNRVFRLSK